LVALARQKGLALGCAPGNLLSDPAQFTWQLLREGRLGTVRMIYADGNFGRVTQWNANPEPFLRIGPLFDGAVYPLALLTAYFGPVVRVHAAHHALLLEEHEVNGRSFQTATPDHATALLELGDGPLVRLTASMYVPYQTQHFNSIEFHGDRGSLYLRNCGEMNWSEGAVAWAPLGEGYAPLSLPYPPQERDYAAAVVELATAVTENRPPRAAAGDQAAHLAAVIAAINRCAGSGEMVEIASGFTAVAPIPR
jgi:alcohol dehydrogenase (NADP+)